MGVPLPRDEEALLTPPDAAEVAAVARGVLSAVAGPHRATPLQRLLVGALFEAMTGHAPEVDAAAPLDADGLATTLALRDAQYRQRIVEVMALVALVVHPLPPEVSAQVERYAEAMSVTDDLVGTIGDLSRHSLALVQIDFDRNGYLHDVAQGAHAPTSDSGDVWGLSESDPDLAARWRSLSELPAESVGRGVHDFYLARGFEFPGTPGSAPPLLAQHDWVHIVADYGTTLENELEVFGFIARANDDPRAFSLLAMVVSLFETGALARGAGLFEADAGHLSRKGMATRLADAMRRGALCRGSNDFLALDWFAVADRPVDVLRRELDLRPKGRGARAAGSVGPWEVGGISAFQQRSGQLKAERDGQPYESFGAASE